MKFAASFPHRLLITALAFFFVFPGTLIAQKSLVPLMLDVPGPPAPKHGVVISGDIDSEDIAAPDFYSYKNPPADDAPIDQILKYWEHWGSRNPSRRFSLTPTDAVADRILAELRKDPDRLNDFLNLSAASGSETARILSASIQSSRGQ